MFSTGTSARLFSRVYQRKKMSSAKLYCGIIHLHTNSLIIDLLESIPRPFAMRNVITVPLFNNQQNPSLVWFPEVIILSYWPGIEKQKRGLLWRPWSWARRIFNSCQRVCYFNAWCRLSLTVLGNFTLYQKYTIRIETPKIQKRQIALSKYPRLIQFLELPRNVNGTIKSSIASRAIFQPKSKQAFLQAPGPWARDLPQA